MLRGGCCVADAAWRMLRGGCCVADVARAGGYSVDLYAIAARSPTVQVSRPPHSPRAIALQVHAAGSVEQLGIVSPVSDS